MNFRLKNNLPAGKHKEIEAEYFKVKLSEIEMDQLQITGKLLLETWDEFHTRVRLERLRSNFNFKKRNMLHKYTSILMSFIEASCILQKGGLTQSFTKPFLLSFFNFSFK